MIDSERAITTTFAFIARRAVTASGTPELSKWLADVATEAIQSMLRDDVECARDFENVESDDVRYAPIAKALGVSTSRAVRACAAFHRLPDPVRRDFHEVAREGRSAEDVSSAIGRSVDSVRANVRRAFLTLTLLRDPGERVHPGGSA